MSCNSAIGHNIIHHSYKLLKRKYYKVSSIFVNGLSKQNCLFGCNKDRKMGSKFSYQRKQELKIHQVLQNKESCIVIYVLITWSKHCLSTVIYLERCLKEILVMGRSAWEFISRKKIKNFMPFTVAGILLFERIKK